MSAYNFKARYVEHIRSGRKRHTIRAEGKRRHARPGERVQLYTGMRTKACRKIMPDPLCTKVESIEMARVPLILPNGEEAGFTLVSVCIDGQRLEPDECVSLAYADGFDNFTQMVDFFESRLPFKGKLIHWRPRALP